MVSRPQLSDPSRRFNPNLQGGQGQTSDVAVLCRGSDIIPVWHSSSRPEEQDTMKRGKNYILVQKQQRTAAVSWVVVVGDSPQNRHFSFKSRLPESEHSSSPTVSASSSRAAVHKSWRGPKDGRTHVPRFVPRVSGLVGQGSIRSVWNISVEMGSYWV